MKKLRLAVNTHNMGGAFCRISEECTVVDEPARGGRWIRKHFEFQVHIKGHNQREYEDKWQGWQNWTDKKLATKPTKDDQQPVLLLPARWWPDMLPEFEKWRIVAKATQASEV